MITYARACPNTGQTRPTRWVSIAGASNAIRLVETEDGLFVIGADATGQLLELLARSTESRELLVFHAMPLRPAKRQEVFAMTKTHNGSGKPDQPLAERLAPMSIAEIDAMSDHEVAELMGGTPEEIAVEPTWTWREAAKAATDDYIARQQLKTPPGDDSLNSRWPPTRPSSTRQHNHGWATALGSFRDCP